jgi:hypothetical protein
LIPFDARDADRNGVIDVRDSKICTKQCTLRNCAVVQGGPI